MLRSDLLSGNWMAASGFGMGFAVQDEATRKAGQASGETKMQASELRQMAYQMDTATAIKPIYVDFGEHRRHDREDNQAACPERQKASGSRERLHR